MQRIAAVYNTYLTIHLLIFLFPCQFVSTLWALLPCSYPRNDYYRGEGLGDSIQYFIKFSLSLLCDENCKRFVVIYFALYRYALHIFLITFFLLLLLLLFRVVLNVFRASKYLSFSGFHSQICSILRFCCCVYISVASVNIRFIGTR